MAARSVKVAFTAGGMYDRLYGRLPEFERATGIAVDVAFKGTHPQLNAHLEDCGASYDLVSTHTKYTPSQRSFLASLEGFDTSDFFPMLLELSSIEGKLYGVPRNIDLRLLHYRTDLIDPPPATWEEFVSVARAATRPPLYGCVFTGMESGLFGTFFELAESAGARLFPASLEPELNNEGGRWALGILRELYQSGAAPPQVADWHYDEVHQFFREGHAAMIADWPGYYGSYRAPDSAVRDKFAVATMPAGPTGRVCCYAGSHTFALTKQGADHAGARELLRFLTAAEQQTLEAQQGSTPVRLSVMEQQRARASAVDALRMSLLSASIEQHLIVPPKLAFYPRIEDILWRSVRAAMTGELPATVALVQMEKKISECVAHAARE